MLELAQCTHFVAPDGMRSWLSILIPNPIDQNPWVHWRSPMDMMRQG